jgi:hypothetical protein
MKKMGINIHFVRFEVFTAVTMKNGVLWERVASVSVNIGSLLSAP